MRCLTLADFLTDQGAAVSFVCRDLAGNLALEIETRGYRVFLLPAPDSKIDRGLNPDDYAAWLGVGVEQDACETRDLIAGEPDPVDWLIVDHYALDAEWHRFLRPSVGNIMVIDDLDNRRYDCDVLLDQNISVGSADRYGLLVPATCRRLLGPRYALLRPEFAVARDRRRPRGRLRRILVFLGGVDRPNVTARAIQALTALPDQNFEAQVIAGRTNPHRHELVKTCSAIGNISYFEEVHDMAARMANSDLAIGAGGTATWERCCVGLPSVIIAVAENQIANAMEIERIGAGRYMGRAESVSSGDIGDAIGDLLGKPAVLLEMKRKALAVIDGCGVRRVAQALAAGGRDKTR